MKYIMETFQLFTILIASMVFIGLFIYSAVIFYSGKNKIFPPDMAPCPDGWKLNKDGTCKIPTPGPTANLGNLENTGHQIFIYDNIKDQANYSYLPTYYDIITDETYKGRIDPNLPLGYYTKDIPAGYDVENPQLGVVNFADPGWASYGDPYCAMKKWAKTQNIQWDGILSYNNFC
jgi:hypothetical protein